MSKRLLSTALAAALGVVAFAPQAARAADSGIITFSGKVLSSTCNVSNATNGNLTVTLPDVQATGFTASIAGTTPFSLALTGCPTTPSGVKVGAQFSAGSGTGIDGTSGAIMNTTGASFSNVEVQLTDASGAAINLNSNSNPVSDTIASDGTATLSYKAQYYQPASVATVSAGTVTASVAYTLTYN